jgi:hypothetical protein
VAWAGAAQRLGYLLAAWACAASLVSAAALAGRPAAARALLGAGWAAVAAAWLFGPAALRWAGRFRRPAAASDGGVDASDASSDAAKSGGGGGAGRRGPEGVYQGLVLRGPGGAAKRWWGGAVARASPSIIMTVIFIHHYTLFGRMRILKKGV